MKRTTRILSLGLLLSISSAALAGEGDRHDGYYGNSGEQHHGTRQDVHYNSYHNDRRHNSKHHRHGKRHYVSNKRHARRHSHHDRYCYDRHPRAYVAPRAHYGYRSPSLEIVYQQGAGFYIGGG